METIKLIFLSLVAYCEKEKAEQCLMKPRGEYAKNWGIMGSLMVR